MEKIADGVKRCKKLKDKVLPKVYKEDLMWLQRQANCLVYDRL